MSEKLLEHSSMPVKESRSEKILMDNVDSIKLYLKIFNELPIDLENMIDSENQYCQKNSLIVIADENSFLGKRTAEFMIEYDELENARNGQDPPDVVMGILSREDLSSIIDSYGNTKMELPPNIKQKANVAVISDKPIVITLSLPR